MQPQQLHWQLHPGSGPYLLLVHGFLSSSNQWRPNLAQLAKVCQPVTVDLWGHYLSPSPAEPDAYHPRAYVAQFEQIRQALGCEQWLVCGYSLGAGLTLAYSLAHPTRVVAQAFTNSSSALATTKVQQTWRQQAQASASKILDGGTQAMTRLPVHPCHAQVLPSDIKQQLVNDAQQHSPLGVANTLLHTNPNASVRDQLQLNRHATLLLWGQHERRFVMHKEHLQATMPCLEICALAAGHGVNMEAPTAFNDALSRFVVAQSCDHAAKCQ